jgi:hypothetical protein
MLHHVPTWVLVVAAAVMPRLCAAGSIGDEPPQRGTPAGNLSAAAEPTLNSIIAKIRGQDPGTVQPETIPLGIPTPSPGGATAADDGQETSGEPWRYQWFADRWWYWMPDDHWIWWDEHQGWTDYRAPAPWFGRPQQSSPSVASQPRCYGTRAAVGPGAVTVHAGPVFVGVAGGHVAVSVFGIGFGF